MTRDNTDLPCEIGGDVFFEVPSSPAITASQSPASATTKNNRSQDFEADSDDDDDYDQTIGDEEDQVGTSKREETESKEGLVGKSLREGYLQFGPSRKKKERFGKIILRMAETPETNGSCISSDIFLPPLPYTVYVPETFDFTTHDGIMEIFKALGIQEPDLVFKFQYNHGIVPSYKEVALPIGLWRDKQFKKTDDEFSLPLSQDLITISTNFQSPSLISGVFSSTPTSSYADDTAYGSDAGNGVDKSFSVGDIPDDDFHKICDIGAFADPSNAIDQEKIRQMENDFSNILNAVADFESTAFLITDPFRGNRLSELACKASANSNMKPPTIGLFHAEDEAELGQFSVLKNIVGRRNDDLNEQIQTLRSLRKQKSLGLWMRRLEYKNTEFSGRKSHARLPVPGYLFQKESVPIGEIMPTSNIQIDCNYTKYEERVHRKNNCVTHIPGGLANECSHRLVFATKEKKELFTNIISNYFSTGSFACGGTHSEMKATAESLKKGEPLFIIEGTGNVATIAADFLRKKGAAARKYDTNDRVEELNREENSSTMTRRFSCEETLNEGLNLLRSNRRLFNNYNDEACYVSNSFAMACFGWDYNFN